MKTKIYDICLYSLLGALIFILKFIMSPLPNIEPVSLLLIVYTIAFKKKVFYSLASYVFLEILIYGIGFWSIGYIYIWIILIIITMSIFKINKSTNILLWSIVSCIYGMIFGALYIPLYFISGGSTFAFTWWLSGIPYDIMHGISNFILCLILFKPLLNTLMLLKKKHIIGG